MGPGISGIAGGALAGVAVVLFGEVSQRGKGLFSKIKNLNPLSKVKGKVSGGVKSIKKSAGKSVKGTVSFAKGKVSYVKTKGKNAKAIGSNVTKTTRMFASRQQKAIDSKKRAAMTLASRRANKFKAKINPEAAAKKRKELAEMINKRRAKIKSRFRAPARFKRPRIRRRK